MNHSMKGFSIIRIIVVGLIIILGLFYISKDSIREQTNSSMITGGFMEIIESDVEYFKNSKGFYARPKVAGIYPGVVMIHEWWGLNDNIKDVARTLARNGYHVLAVDLYKGKVATSSDQARIFTGSIDKEETLENMKSAVNYLRKEGSPKVASLGWCFGGGQSLQLSLSDEKLDATIIYYGQLVTDPAVLKGIDAPVLGIFGDKDTSISTTSVKAFGTALSNLNIKNEIYIYPGVGHAFANPTGMNYAASATKDAWDKTLKFLSENIKFVN